MQRKQNTQQRGCPCEGRREAENNKGAHSMSSRRNKDVCGEFNLFDRVVDKRNLYRAYKQIFANKGAAGIDGKSHAPIYPLTLSSLVAISLFSMSVTLFLFCEKIHLYHF